MYGYGFKLLCTGGRTESGRGKCNTWRSSTERNHSKEREREHPPFFKKKRKNHDGKNPEIQSNPTTLPKDKLSPFLSSLFPLN